MRLHSRLRTLEQSLRDVYDNAESEEGCICFPPDEPPDLALKAEIEAPRLSVAQFTAIASASWLL